MEKLRSPHDRRLSGSDSDAERSSQLSRQLPALKSRRTTLNEFNALKDDLFQPVSFEIYNKHQNYRFESN